MNAKSSEIELAWKNIGGRRGVGREMEIVETVKKMKSKVAGIPIKAWRFRGMIIRNEE